MKGTTGGKQNQIEKVLERCAEVWILKSEYENKPIWKFENDFYTDGVESNKQSSIIHLELVTHSLNQIPYPFGA